MARVNFTALVPFVLSRAAWQDALWATDLLVPITLDIDQPQIVEEIWRARVGDRPVKFSFKQSDAIGLTRSRADLAPYSFLLSAPGSGNMNSWAVGFAALYAYVLRTNGLFVDSVTLETVPPSTPSIKKQADNFMSACYASLETFSSRYPEERDPDPGPMFIRATLHK